MVWGWTDFGNRPSGYMGFVGLGHCVGRFVASGICVGRFVNRAVQGCGFEGPIHESARWPGCISQMAPPHHFGSLSIGFWGPVRIMRAQVRSLSPVP